MRPIDFLGQSSTYSSDSEGVSHIWVPLYANINGVGSPNEFTLVVSGMHQNSN